MLKIFLNIVLALSFFFSFACSADEAKKQVNELIGDVWIGADKYISDLKNDNIMVKKMPSIASGKKKTIELFPS